MGFYSSRKLDMLAIVLAAIVLAGTLLQCNGASVPSIVTPTFFNRIANKADKSCAGRGFYTRTSFLQAARAYPRFASGSTVTAKREIAAFFAQLTHESGHFCYIEEIGGRSKVYCDRSSRRYPCAPGKRYYGRGPIQITWNYNYGAAGRSIGFDGLKNPDIVARNPVISFKTAFWFWMNNCHNAIVSGRGFGATIRAINGGECNGGNPTAVTNRVKYYTDYCRQLGVTPGNNLRC